MFFSFLKRILRFFSLAHEYLRPIRVVFPLFLFNQMLAAFSRNDGNPNLATFGVLSGGIFNIFGDYFFVFTCGLGLYERDLPRQSALQFLLL